MTDSLRELEQQRADLWAQILELGDFRPGSITTTQDVVATRTATAISRMSPDMVRT